MKTKYEVGQEVITNVRVTETVSSIEINSHGTIYHLLSGKVYPEMVLASIENKPTQPITPQGDKAKFKVGQRVISTDNIGYFVKQIATILDIDKSDPRTPFKVMFDERGLIMWCHSGDVEPYTEPEHPNSPNCAVDNLIYGYQSASFFKTELLNRNKLIEPKLTVTREMLVKLGACSSGLAEFDKKFPSGKGEFEEVRKATDVSNSCWLHNHRFSISTMQNEQPKEAVKLYCVKDYFNWNKVKWLTEGKLYTFENGSTNFDDGNETIKYGSFEEFARYNKNMAACLIRAEKRPAKVGEWIYVTRSADSRITDGYIYEVAPYGDEGSLFVKCAGGQRLSDGAACVCGTEYLVLDGYKSEPEKVEPTYLNMRVVCVEKGYEQSSPADDITVGKDYSIVKGKLTDDVGHTYCLNFKSLKHLSIALGHKFIEYKGEQS